MNCDCGGEFKVLRRSTQCLDDAVYEVVDFKCRLCGKRVYGDLQKKEPDWEGFQ